MITYNLGEFSYNVRVLISYNLLGSVLLIIFHIDLLKFIVYQTK